jgi:hypothetical protein
VSRGVLLHRRALLGLFGAVAAAPLLPPLAFGQAREKLLLAGGAVARAKAAINTHPQGVEILRRVTRNAEELLAKPPAERRNEPGRAVILPYSREVLERVQTLGAAHFLLDDARFARRGAAELLAAAAQPDWNPVHFLDTAEMSASLGLGLDWFGDAMEAADRKTVANALLLKGIEPGFAEHARGAFWTKATHNWNIVCNGGMTIAALALSADAPDQSRRMIDLSLSSARIAFASFAPDGGWIEGPSYWDYATRYAVYLLAALESAGIGDRGLAAQPGFSATGRFFMHATGPTGLVYNYADSPETIRRSAHRFWLSRRFNRPDWAGDELARKGSPRGMHALWFPEVVGTPAASEEPLDAHFTSAQVAMFRSAWGDPAAVYLACKGGDNAANHAHLDLGSFVLESGGERFAIDLGPDDYALEGYFDRAKRYGYLRNASPGHNVLLKDGANQLLGAKAALASFRSTPGFACAVAQLDEAYAGLKHRRGFALVDRAWALVVDEAAPERASDLQWQMLTRAAVSLKGAGAVLTQGQATLHARIVAPAGAEFAVESAAAPPPQDPNKGVTRLIVRFPGQTAPLRVAVAFGPTDAPPPRVRGYASVALDRWSGA